MKITLISLTVIAGMTLAGGTVAHEFGPRPGHQPPMLTTDQRQDVALLRQQLKAELAVYQADKQQLRQQHRALLDADHWNSEEAQSVAENQYGLMRATGWLKAHFHQQLFNLLADGRQQSSEPPAPLASKRSGFKSDFRALIERLELSAEQRELLRPLLQQLQNNGQQMGELLQDRIRQQRALITTQTLTEQRWQAVMDQQSEKWKALRIEALKLGFEVRQVLDERQRALFDENRFGHRPLHRPKPSPHQ